MIKVKKLNHRGKKVGMKNEEKTSNYRDRCAVRFRTTVSLTTLGYAGTIIIANKKRNRDGFGYCKTGN